MIQAVAGDRRTWGPAPKRAIRVRRRDVVRVQLGYQNLEVFGRLMAAFRPIWVSGRRAKTRHRPHRLARPVASDH